MRVTGLLPSITFLLCGLSTAEMASAEEPSLPQKPPSSPKSQGEGGSESNAATSATDHAEPPLLPAPEASAATEPHELDSIVVEGKLVQSPAKAPSTATRVEEDELQKFEQDDVHQVLLQVPGVQVRGEDGVGLRPNIGIRGTNPNRSSKVTLLEDGVLLGPAPYSAPAAYYFPMVTRMTAVEVHKGGSQIRFGPRALGGAINLVTAEIPSGKSAKADIAVGEYDYVKAHARGGYGTERTGFLLEAVHNQSSGFKDLDGGGNTGFDKNELMAKWHVQSDPSAATFQRLALKLGLATERSNETYLGLTDEDFEKTPYRRYAASALDQMKWHRGQAVATYTVIPSDNLEVNVTAYRQQFTRDWMKVDGVGGATLDDVLSNPDSPVNRTYYDLLTGQVNSGGADEELLFADNYRWFVSQGIQSTVLFFTQTGPLNHEIEVGARLHYDSINRLHRQVAYRMEGAEDGSVGTLVPSTTPTRTTARNQGQAYALALHAVDTLGVGSFTLTPGARLELVWTDYQDYLDASLDNSQTQVGVLPGMGAHYALTDELGFLIGGYRGYGPAAPQGRASDAPEPRGETSTTWEAGARYGTEKTHAEAVGYWIEYGNLTAECTQSQGCSADLEGTQFDGGKARVWGLEADLGHKWQVGSFTIPARATYGLTMSAFRTDFTSENPEWGDVSIGDELPYLPKHQGTASLGLAQEEEWAVDVNTTVASRSRETAGFGPMEKDSRTDGYALLGLAGRVRLYGKLWLYSRATNLLNQTYLVSRRPHGARPGAPRWIHVGLTIEY